MQINLANLLSRRSAAFLLLYMLVAGCEESPAPAEAKRSKMFADFFVRYVAPDQEIRGQVSFWEGLSWTKLSPVEPEGLISFEGQRMTAKQLSPNQIRFSETHQGEYEESLAFRFRNFDDRYLQYELKMTPIRDFFVQGKISKSTGATFVINGGVMNKDESLVFLFTNEENVATAITVEGPNADVEIPLSPEQLDGLSLGKGQLYLVKKQHKTESHPNLELTAAVEYYTDSRAIDVEE